MAHCRCDERIAEIIGHGLSIIYVLYPSPFATNTQLHASYVLALPPFAYPRRLIHGRVFVVRDDLDCFVVERNLAIGLARAEIDCLDLAVPSNA